jgi:membrane protein DedA with SNARE-associated domain
VVIGCAMPGMRKVTPIPAGIVRMPVLRFAAYVVLANGLTNTVLVGLGWFLGDQWADVR